MIGKGKTYNRYNSVYEDYLSKKEKKKQTKNYRTLEITQQNHEDLPNPAPSCH